ncbi:MFS transporter [Haloferax sp. DFSO52]|uniref:MFS transporter n=1 Tax=Haloferax sp. DFSO52 TaxID=3388505 RepID=UPI003A8B23CE
MNRRQKWTLAIFLFVLGDGIVVQTRGPLLPAFGQSFSVSESLLGLVAPAGTVGLVATVLTVGMLSGRLDARKFLAIGTGVGIASLLLLGTSVSYPMLLGGFFIQGAAFGVFRALDRPLLGHLYPSQRARIFNLYAATWALGAAAGPLVVNTVLRFGEWRLTYLILVVVFLPTAYFIWTLEFPTETWSEKRLTLTGLASVLRTPSIAGMVCALVLTGGIEGIIFTWLPFYATQFVPQSTANLLLSGFLIMYIPGRLVYSRLTSRVRSLTLVAALSVGSLPILYVAFVSTSTTELVIAVLGLGLLVSGFYPTLSAFGVDALPERSGPVNAVAVAGNYLGLSTLPVAVGALSSAYGISTGIQLTLPAMVGVTVVILFTRFQITTHGKEVSGDG